LLEKAFLLRLRHCLIPIRTAAPHPSKLIDEWPASPDHTEHSEALGTADARRGVLQPAATLSGRSMTEAEVHLSKLRNLFRKTESRLRDVRVSKSKA